MKKKILIIGNGAKEYALAKKMSEKHEIYITPASDTLKEFATCLDIREDNSAELLDFVLENGIDMTIPISTKSLKSDIVDLFNKNNQKILAPNSNSAQIIYDKSLAKKVLYKLRIPTPKFGVFEKSNMVLDYIRKTKPPFVLKTDEVNSATIFTSSQVAKPLIDKSFIEKDKKIVVEDYIYGTPFSFYTLTDGYKALPLGSSITYKYALEGGGGQLTSGRGACAPNYKLTYEQEAFIMDSVIYPTLDYLEIEKTPYVGILGVNGILTDDGKIFVLGWHSFMQDCDAQAILNNIDDDLYSLFYSCIVGSFSDEIDSILLKDIYSTSITLVCKNRNNVQNVIEGVENIEDDVTITFYPSVIKNKYLEYEANYGEVLSLTTSASTISSASQKMYANLKELSYNGLSYRKDVCILK